MSLRPSCIGLSPLRLQPIVRSRSCFPSTFCKRLPNCRCKQDDSLPLKAQPMPSASPQLPQEETRLDKPPKKNVLEQLKAKLRILFLSIKKAPDAIFKHPIFRLILFSLSIYCILKMHSVCLKVSLGIHGFFSLHRGYRINVLYSEFVKQVEAGKVETVFFESKSNGLRFKYRSEMWDQMRQQMQLQNKTPDEIERRLRRIQTCSKVVPGQTDSLTHLLKQKNVNYGVADPSVGSFLGSFVSTMFWLWVPLLPLIYLFKGTLDARMGGKSKKVKTVALSTVRFGDVAGMDEAKLELLEVVELLKDPEKYARLNAKVPAGVLLCGPTGTGKTLLARAVAGEAGVPFFAVSASEFVEMFVGRGAARIRELFREARKHTPCVVFIDEIDSVGGMRGTSFNEERDQTLNQLLVELDGFEDNKSIVLLAATNRLNSLDPALLRPGRLTRKITISLPDASGRAAILAVHLRAVPMASLQDKIDACGILGKLSDGYSGAELANAVNEAALMAARAEHDFVGIQDLLKGLQRSRGSVNDSNGVIGWVNAIQAYALEQTWRQRQRRRLIS